jgi:DNA modification methylase
MTMLAEGQRWMVIHGDCADVIHTIGAADALVTDPPYGVNLGAHLASKDQRNDRVLVKHGYDGMDDTPENFRTNVVPSIKLALDLTAGRGAVFSAGHMMWDLPRPAAVGGVFLPAACGRCAWGFNSFAHCLLYGRAPALELGAKPIGIASTETAEPNGHPVPKPIGWMMWLVSLVTSPNDIVIDPFCGSGTTGVAALRLGRRFIGIEKNARYAAIARERLAAESQGSTLQAARAGQVSLFGGQR